MQKPHRDYPLANKIGAGCLYFRKTKEKLFPLAPWELPRLYRVERCNFDLIGGRSNKYDLILLNRFENIFYSFLYKQFFLPLIFSNYYKTFEIFSCEIINILKGSFKWGNPTLSIKINKSIGYMYTWIFRAQAEAEIRGAASFYLGNIIRCIMIDLPYISGGDAYRSQSKMSVILENGRFLIS